MPENLQQLYNAVLTLRDSVEILMVKVDSIEKHLARLNTKEQWQQ